MTNGETEIKQPEARAPVAGGRARPSFEQHRYVAFQVLSQAKLMQQDIHNAVWHALLNFLGELGVAEAGVWPVRAVWDDSRQQGLVRCRSEAVEKVRTALALISYVENISVCARVLGVAGTISAAKRKYFGERDLTTFMK